ncbi:DUF4267 domain-containing protein [Aspergillus mulundensis]|uniref:Uncharacterized protein n=1 Tax=Aspergillus mulundensis TaxID=1810919 RepID=A0A3D8R9H2_9EURO|nr:hypothetical protein DSM5745_08186 [Aspergillus mulundensis]RDW70675.1 hypothetical protein DSM5745_08186 [Aspergillus mulundensis]
MSAFSPIPAYTLGVLSIGLGANSFLRPSEEYERFGLPRDSPASPLMYIKAIRESTYGVALIALQYQGHEDALTTVAAVVSLAALADGFLVRAHGGTLRGMGRLGGTGRFSQLRRGGRGGGVGLSDGIRERNRGTFSLQLVPLLGIMPNGEKTNCK